MDLDRNQLICSGSANRLQARYGLPGDQHPAGGSPIHVLDYWRILTKRRWMVLTAVLAVLVIAAIDNWSQTPIYRANLKLQIDNEQRGFLPFDSGGYQGIRYVDTEEFLKTQIEVLTSRTMATRVIRALELDKDARFQAESQASSVIRVVEWGRNLLRRPASPRPRVAKGKSPSRNGQKLSPLSAVLASALTVDRPDNSRIVRVSYDSPDPTLAADILNALAAEYIQINFETRYEAATAASDFLAKRLVDLKAQVEGSEEELVGFARQHDIYTTAERENVSSQKLADLNTELTGAQAERIRKESVWRIARQATPGQFPDILRSDQISKLESGIAQLRQRHARLRALYKPDWPDVKQSDNQLVEAEKQLLVERKSALNHVRSEYNAALQREKLLSEALEAHKREANTQNRNSIQYNILKRDVESSKQLYNGLLQRMKEAGIASALKTNNIHVVDPAEPPASPYKPDRMANMSQALLVGLLFGIALALFLEYLESYFDRSVKTPEDIERFLRLPFLGLIPSLGADRCAAKKLRLPGLRLITRQLTGGHPSLKHSNGDSGKGQAEMQNAIELITHYDPRSMISEAYRGLRTSLLLSASGDRAPKSLLICSSQAGEGKTSVALNLSVTLAQTGERVLLLDGDMRKPRIHGILELENTDGLSTFLSGSSAGSCPLIRPGKIPNLFAFTSGSIPPDPAELLSSLRMRRGLAALDQFFDRIVIDSPPLLSVSDARILATLADGVILVIHGGRTNKEAAMRSKRLLEEVGARILGTILNNVDVHSTGAHYYSKYYYGCGYDGGPRTPDAQHSAASSEVA